MTQRSELNQSNREKEPDAVYLSHTFFGKLAEGGRAIPYGGSVMLGLACRIESDGSVAISQAELVEKSKTTLKKVMETIQRLSDVGFISSAKIGFDPDKTITCWISPDLIRRDAPEGF